LTRTGKPGPPATIRETNTRLTVKEPAEVESPSGKVEKPPVQKTLIEWKTARPLVNAEGSLRR
jgi:hypothetical protein